MIVTLKQVAIVNQETYKASDNWGFVNYLDTGNITANNIDAIQKIDIAIEKLPSRARRKVRDGDIIYSVVRPNKLHYGVVKSPPSNFLVSTGFATISAIKGKVDYTFLYYYLTQKNVIAYLQSIAEQSVSTYPTLKPSDIENLELDLPDIETQHQIGKILSSIDEKISNNNQINDNLAA